MCPMSGSTHLSTWVDAQTKQRFSSAAARQGLSESALLKRLIDQMLAVGPEEAIAPLVTVRLVPEDRALLRERAAARTMPAANVRLRAHPGSSAAARPAPRSGALGSAVRRERARGARP